MIVHLLFPDQIAGRGIEGVHVCLEVAEVRRVSRSAAACYLADADGAANACLRRERPVRASGRGVEGIHAAGVAADEDAACGDRRVAVGLSAAGKTERPLQRQPRDIGCGDARLWLEA